MYIGTTLPYLVIQKIIILVRKQYASRKHTLGWLFLWVLMLIFLRIGRKMQIFVPANISYRALEFIDPVPFSRTNRKN